MEHVVELVARHEQSEKSKIAVSKWKGGGRFEETSYGELCQKMHTYHRLCAHLAPERMIIPILAGKSADTVAFMLGAMEARRTFCLLNTKYRGPQIEAVLAATNSPFCIIDAAGLVALRGAWKDHPRIARTKWVVLGGSELSGIYADAAQALRAAADVTLIDDHHYGDGESDSSSTAPSADIAAICLFTSGSTGAPKGVLISEADLVARVTAEIAWFDLTKAATLLSILPFSFDVGLNQLLTGLAVGGEIVLLDSWLPADILTASHERKVTGISGVPSIWQDLINAGVRFDTSGRHSALRYITISGGSLSKPYLERLPAAAGGVQIFKTYGQTEAFRATSLRPEDFEKLDSVGKPFPGARVYVVRDDGTRCDAGEVGEVVHTGLGVMMGYLGNVDSDKLRKNPFFGKEDPSALAVFTGDIGYLDHDGYLFLKGRRDGMLKVMGNRVYPQEVTNQILRISGVQEAVVCGVAGEGGQTSVVAFLVTTPDAALSSNVLKRMLGARLPPFMVPREIVLVDHVPRTASGKADERTLVQRYVAGALRGRGGTHGTH
jgi:acyl-CoA synthetase (AMP-forming)/AMP-acid ligase II